MKPGWQWPWIIAALLVATAAGQGVMLYAATHDDTFAVEPDYYQKAVAFDDVIAQERANARLGWRTAAELGAFSSAGADFSVRLTDAAGAPVLGASARVTAIHNLDGARHLLVTLADRGGGTYAARLPLDHPGLWEFRFEAERGADRFTADLRGEAAAR